MSEEKELNEQQLTKRDPREEWERFKTEAKGFVADTLKAASNGISWMRNEFKQSFEELQKEKSEE